MNHQAAAHAAVIPGIPAPFARPPFVRVAIVALVALAAVAAAALMVHRSASGAAPAETLVIIGETFDKGF